MESSELELVKQIPGYKMILKTVLKGQIQQLVKQLSMHTDEESVILTACVGDGTHSHFGSDLGKIFLDNHDDVKSQFLGFCLTSHHNNQLLKDNLTCGPGNLPGVTSLKQQVGALSRSSPKQRHEPYTGKRCNSRQAESKEMTVRQTEDHLSFSSKAAAPKQQGGTVSRSSPRQRQKPYTAKRPNNRQAESLERSTRPTEDNMLSRKQENFKPESDGSIKVECGSPEIIESLTGTKEQTDQCERKVETSENQSRYHQNEATFQREAEKDNSDNSNISSTEISKKLTVHVSPENLFTNSCYTSSLPSDKTKRKLWQQSGCDSEIKLEPVSESDIKLELTGLEPGSSNVKGNMDHSADTILNPKSEGATSHPDVLTKPLPQYLEVVSGQLVGEGMSPVRVHVCDICSKPFPSKWELGRHRRTHTGEKPYTCEYCSRAFSDKSNMNQHIKGVHFKQPFRKDRQDLGQNNFNI